MPVQVTLERFPALPREREPARDKARYMGGVALMARLGSGFNGHYQSEPPIMLGPEDPEPEVVAADVVIDLREPEKQREAVTS